MHEFANAGSPCRRSSIQHLPWIVAIARLLALPCAVIAVSAFTETDGLPGGLGPVPSCLPLGHDDHLATFSNFGSVVHLATPGVCVASTADGITYVRLLGTNSPLRTCQEPLHS